MPLKYRPYMAPADAPWIRPPTPPCPERPRLPVMTVNGKAPDKSGNVDTGIPDPLLFAQYYPDGSVESATEFTPGIKYDVPDGVNRTITVKPFCDTGNPENDNSSLVGRVVIPPFVDASGNGYISDYDGTRYKVVGVSGGSSDSNNTNLTAIVAPSMVTTIGDNAFNSCTALASASFPAASTIGVYAFFGCTSLTIASLPSVTDIGENAFFGCTSITSISLPSVTTIGDNAFGDCNSLASVDFGDTPRPSVPTLGSGAFSDVPTSCIVIVPDEQYDAWTAATMPDSEHEGETLPNPWYALVTAGYKFLRHSEWEYARRYEVDKKADKASPSAEGNLASLTQDGSLADSGSKPSDFATAVQGAKADTAVQPAAVAGFVDGAEYDAEYGDPPKPTILLKHGDAVVSAVDATDFVIDGMVSNVEVKAGNLVITFNTDSGKLPISIPLTDIFGPVLDDAVTASSANGVKSSGIWSAIWGTATTAFASLYDWCASQLAGKASKSDLALHPTLFDIGGGMWVFASDGEGFVVQDGEVATLDAGKTSFAAEEYYSTNLTFAYAPNVTTVGEDAFAECTSLATVLLPAATTVGTNAFSHCTSLTTLDLSSFTVAQVEENASAWGIDPPGGHTVTIACSDGTYTITGD